MKFDNCSFGWLQTPDRQTDGNVKPLFRTLEVLTHRENMKIAIRPMDSITYISLAYAREVKRLYH